MILVTGGRNQGKLAFALKLSENKDYIDGKDCTLDDIKKYKIINNYEDFIKNNLDREDEYFTNLDDDKIIILSEIGSGVVPIDKTDRLYRKKVGTIAQVLAKKSKDVYRVFCGIESKIK